MSKLKKIYVDFNNRINPKLGEFYRVDVDELQGVDLLERVLATDYDELELEVVVVVLRRDLGFGVVEFAPTTHRSLSTGVTPTSYTVEQSLGPAVATSPQELVGTC